MVFTFVFCTIGFFGLGITLHYQLVWIIPLTFLCLVVFGLSFLNIVTYAYITDCLREHAPEAFASLNLNRLYEFGTHAFDCSDVRIELCDCAVVIRPGASQGVFDYRGDAYGCHVVDHPHVPVWETGKKLDCEEATFQIHCGGIDRHIVCNPVIGGDCSRIVLTPFVVALTPRQPSTYITRSCHYLLSNVAPR